MSRVDEDNDSRVESPDEEAPSGSEEPLDGAAVDEAEEAVDALAADPVVIALAGRIEELERDLAERDHKLREYFEAHQHAIKEMEAARGRMDRDRTEEVDRDRAALAGRLLEVVDDLDRSLQGGASTANLTAVLEGVALVRNRVMNKLVELGVAPMTTIGESFDPNFHEAVGMIPVTDAEQDQQIVAEECTGFLFKGKLLRAARVIVGTHTEA